MHFPTCNLPKGIFPGGKFPNVQLPKSVVAAALAPPPPPLEPSQPQRT